MTKQLHTDLVARLRSVAHFHRDHPQSLMDWPTQLLLEAAEALREVRPTEVEKDAARWVAFCNLWAASTILEASQDDSGYWVIRQIEPAEEITFKALVGETPEAAIDAAMNLPEPPK